ncbi:MAG: hypothetical protein U0R17_01870 [Acidimicrobiia bacterium]
MRRSPNDFDSNGTNVFSSDAWGNSAPNYPVAETSSDLSAYAASLIPEGNGKQARTSRYAPSSNSSAYEDTGYKTNSTSDPFQHSAYDGGHTPLAHNASYDDMPAPTRKTRLGEPIPSITPDSIPRFGVPQNLNPTNLKVEQSAPCVQPMTEPVQHVPAAPVGQVAYEPIPAPQQSSMTQPAPDVVEEQVPVSDFEQEFIKAQPAPAENVIDIREDVLPVGEPFVSPSLFTSSTSANFGHSYSSAEEFFAAQTQEISDEDRFYKEPTQRETVQIDLSFVKNIVNKILANKIAIILLAVVLAVTAFLIVRPVVSDSNSPKPAPVMTDQASTEKTVVENTTPAPSVTVAPPAQNSQSTNGTNSGGVIITYDKNGNAQYSGSPTNQNFNGE